MYFICICGKLLISLCEHVEKFLFFKNFLFVKNKAPTKFRVIENIARQNNKYVHDNHALLRHVR